MRQFLSLCAIGLAAMAVTTPAAHAGSVDVQVGYADNLRPSAFFPNPFNNGLTSPGSYSLGGHTVNYLGGGGSIDAGAFRLINTGVVDVTLNPGVRVDGFANGGSFQIWDSIIGGGLVLHPGDQAIFTQTGSYNFDSSDEVVGGNSPFTPSSAKPVVHFFLNGSLTDTPFTDSGQVLNTGGFDLANFPAFSPNKDGNEALNWRDIGTTGIGDPAGTGVVPEPTSMALLATGGLPLLGFLRRRRAA